MISRTLFSIAMAFSVTASAFAATPPAVWSPQVGVATLYDSSGNPISSSNPLPVTGGGGGGGGAVYGPTADGSPAAHPPILVGGTNDGTGTGTVGVAKVSTSGLVSVDGSAVTQPISAVSLPLPVGAATGPTSAAVISVRQTATASAVQLASNSLTNGLVCQALTTNTGIIYLGSSGETTATGYPLIAGQAISYGVANSNQLYLIGSNTTDVLSCTGN